MKKNLSENYTSRVISCIYLVWEKGKDTLTLIFSILPKDYYYLLLPYHPRHFTRTKKEANFHANNYANFIHNLYSKEKKKGEERKLCYYSYCRMWNTRRTENTFLRETTNITASLSTIYPFMLPSRSIIRVIKGRNHARCL